MTCWMVWEKYVLWICLLCWGGRETVIVELIWLSSGTVK